MDPRLRSLVLDVGPGIAFAGFLVLTTGFALGGADESSVRPVPLDAWGYGLCAVAGLVFALRRRAPLLVFAVAFACTALFVARYEGGPIFVAAIAATLVVVAAKPRRVWIMTTLAGAAALAGLEIAEHGVTIAPLGGMAVLLGAAVLFGEVVRLRRAELHEARARATQAERTREEETLRRVAEERLRIAREVHDVVGHGLATISLQAGVAEHLLDARPEEARRAVAAIRTVSRDALHELRAEIGALRGADGAAAPRAPTPGLDSVPELVASMRAAGLDVELDEERNGAGGVADVVGAAGYRIVQEALTNVARHAGPDAHARVRVAVRGDGVELEVVDDGAGPDQDHSESNGLVGMRERAEALGGRFEAGPPPGAGRGFRVLAHLPARGG